MNYLRELDKSSSMKVGILQGGVVVLYVLLFAAGVTQLQNLVLHPAPALGASLVLMAFVVSALICGGAVIMYPAILALRGKIARAIGIILWSGVTMVVSLLVLLIVMTLTH